MPKKAYTGAGIVLQARSLSNATRQTQTLRLHKIQQILARGLDVEHCCEAVVFYAAGLPSAMPDGIRHVVAWLKSWHDTGRTQHLDAFAGLSL